MARTYTAGQRTQVQSRNSGVFLRVLIQNGAGTYVDFSSVNSSDYRLSATVTSSLDQVADTATVVLRAGSGANSIAPAITAATVNATTRGVDVLRGIRIDCAVMTPTSTPISTDYTRIFEGTIDTVRATDRGETLTITARNLLVPVLKATFSGVATYGNGSTAVESLITTILGATMGSPPTLVTPVASSWAPPTNRVQVKRADNAWSAIASLADSIGWLVRYRWNGNTPELRFYAPNRAPSAADLTLSSTEVRDVQTFDFDGDTIRNSVQVVYYTGGVSAQTSSVDATSQAAYGTQPMYVSEAASSSINDSTTAQRFGDAILADLSTGTVSHQITTIHPFWMAEVGDVLDVPSDSVTHDATQRLAVVGITHTFESGGGFSTLLLRGKPASRGRSWLALGTGAFVRPPACVARVSSTTGTTVTVTVTNDPTGGVVRYLGGTATRTAGPLVNVDSAEGTTWTFTKPVAGDLEALFSGTVNGVTDSDSVTISRDTVGVLTRARVITMGATTATVRVSAANPLSADFDGTITIVQLSGMSCTQASAARVESPSSVSTDAVTVSTTDGFYGGTARPAPTFIDYVVSRLAIGSQSGRFTVRVDASGFVGDLDSVDIPPQIALVVGRLSQANVSQSGASYTFAFQAYRADGSQETAPSAVALTTEETPGGGGAPNYVAQTVTWDAVNAWFTCTFTRVAGSNYKAFLFLFEQLSTGTARTEMSVFVPTYVAPVVDPWTYAYVNTPTMYGDLKVFFLASNPPASYQVNVRLVANGTTLPPIVAASTVNALSTGTGISTGVNGKLAAGTLLRYLDAIVDLVDTGVSPPIVVSSRVIPSRSYYQP